MSFLRLYVPLGLYFALLALSLMRWRRLDRCQRVIPWYEGLCIVTTLGLEALRNQPALSMILVHIHTPLQILLFSEMFVQASSLKLRQGLRSVALGFGLFWLGWWAVFGIRSMGTFSIPVFHIHTAVNLIMALVCLADRSRDYRLALTTQAGFWLAAGLLLDAALSLIFFPLRDWLGSHRLDLLRTFSAFHALWVMATHLLYGKALLCPPRTHSS